MGSLDNVFEKENLMKFIIKCNTTINPIEEGTETTDIRMENKKIGGEEVFVDKNEIQNLQNDTRNENEVSNIKKKKKSKKKINEEEEINKMQDVDGKDVVTDELKKVSSQHIRSVPQNVTFVVEPKIDGLSLSVRYNGHGTFLGAGTRGDGIEGEDVSGNIAVGGLIYYFCKQSYL